jgi:hypothetical protein
MLQAQRTAQRRAAQDDARESATLSYASSQFAAEQTVVDPFPHPDPGADPLLMAKGGKQYHGISWLPKDEAALKKLYNDPSTPPAVKKAIQEQQKQLRQRNKAKRSNYDQPDGLDIGAGVILILYGTYRVVRMVPSIAIPELWPTIPISAATP